MSILIKGMEMPDSCYHCKIAESCGHYIANYTDRRHPDCPLIVLPDHHGRLGDLDALIHELNNSHYPGAPYVDAGISIAIGKICDAPTIVEAEDES